MTPDNATQVETRARDNMWAAFCAWRKRPEKFDTDTDPQVPFKAGWGAALAYAKEATPSASVERMLRSAIVGITDDYMTSESHHPGYILISAERFDRLRCAEETVRALTLPVEPEAKGEGKREADVSFVIGEARKVLALVQGCMECNADDERRWMETIQWLERLA